MPSKELTSGYINSSYNSLSINTKSIKKWAKKTWIDRHSSKKTNIWLIGIWKDVQHHSSVKVQIKTTICYLVLVRMAIWKRPQTTNVAEDVEKGKPCTILMRTGYTTKKEYSFLKKLKIGVPLYSSNFSSRYTYIQKNVNANLKRYM